MHKYLKAIGFTELKKNRDIRCLLKQVEETCDSCEMISYDETSEFGEWKKEYGDHVGIADSTIWLIMLPDNRLRDTSTGVYRWILLPSNTFSPSHVPIHSTPWLSW